MKRTKTVWTLEETKLVVVKVFKAVKRGLPLEVGFEWAYNKLSGKSMSKIRSYWYNKLQHKYMNKLNMYRKGIYNVRPKGGTWSPKEDFKVIMAIKEAIVTGFTIDSLLTALAKQLGRTQSAVVTRWYKILSKKDSVVKDLLEYKIAVGMA